MTDQPSLPYGPEPNSGYAGSDTSRERAERDDRSGRTQHRQRQVLDLLAQRGTVGLTYKELCGFTDWHHGQASGALSVLHKEGRIARLTIRRDRCLVYVHPGYTQGRATTEATETATHILMTAMAETLRQWPSCDHRLADPDPYCRCCQARELVRHYDARHKPTGL
jgi:hypothetical protein